MSYSDDQYQGLKAERDALKAEVTRLSGKTGFCIQCEKYARERDRYREVLEKIEGVNAIEVPEGTGPEDMTAQEKRWLRAFGECVCIAKAALAEGDTNTGSLGETK